MKNKIVADGPLRFLRIKAGPAFDKRRSGAMVKAGPDEKNKFPERTPEQIRRLAKTQNHQPSAGTLW
jgi:hypothetical protein